MNLPNDSYTAIIIERGADEAAKILAECCRQRDKDIEALRKTIKGQYINDPWEGLEAFECSECGAALAIADDPVKEQPNFCFNCGVKFDWNGVYEEYLKSQEIEK